jgi:hypothetical protein
MSHEAMAIDAIALEFATKVRYGRYTAEGPKRKTWSELNDHERAVRMDWMRVDIEVYLAAMKQRETPTDTPSREPKA